MEHSSPDVFEMHALIKGNVQGVGFRAMTRYYAKGLGLQGTVRNLADGSVEIYAQGSKQHLKQLIEQLKQETAPGQIEESAIQFFPVEIPHKDFHIIYD